MSDFATLMLEMSLEKAGSLSERERKKKKKEKKTRKKPKAGAGGKEKEGFCLGERQPGGIGATEDRPHHRPALRKTLLLRLRCPSVIFFFLFFSKASPYGNSGLG